MAKSWFYLTLWRGTPPEFTDYATAVLDTEANVGAEIATMNRPERNIERTTSGVALILKTNPARADITARTEVVWNVGRVRP